MTRRQPISFPHRLGAMLALVATILAGCDGGGLDTADIEDLNSAVQDAAQAILDAPAFAAGSVYYDEIDQATGFDWLDYRSSGEYLSVFHVIDPAESLAVIRIDGEEFTAGNRPGETQPWVSLGPAAAAELPMRLDLVGMAEGSALPTVEGAAAEEVEVDRDESDGGVVWTLTTPLQDSTATATWTIDADGTLRAYSLESASLLLPGGGIRIEVELTTVADPPPLALPALDTSLDLAQFAIPAELLDLAE
jgi:hypothetical protein